MKCRLGIFNEKIFLPNHLNKHDETLNNHESSIINSKQSCAEQKFIQTCPNEIICKESKFQNSQKFT